MRNPIARRNSHAHSPHICNVVETMQRNFNEFFLSLSVQAKNASARFLVNIQVRVQFAFKFVVKVFSLKILNRLRNAKNDVRRSFRKTKNLKNLSPHLYSSNAFENA